MNIFAGKKLNIKKAETPPISEKTTIFKNELFRYITSSKFNGPNLNDKMVNRNDIILRIHELENSLTEIEYLED